MIMELDMIDENICDIWHIFLPALFRVLGEILYLEDYCRVVELKLKDIYQWRPLHSHTVTNICKPK